MKNQQLKKLAEKYNFEFIYDLKNFSYVQEKIRVIPYLFAKEKKLLPIEKKENKTIIATSDPLNLSSFEELRLLLNQEIDSLVVCSQVVLDEAIELCYHQKEEETKKIFSDVSEKKEEKTEEGYDLLNQMNDTPSMRFLNAILVEAIQQGASDIHFDPQEGKMNVRYRIDGILFLRHFPHQEIQQQILTRIKVLAQMDIAEQRLPQDGRIKLQLGGREIDFRVSTIPVVYGERLVLRILDRSNVILGLDKLGMSQEIIYSFRRLMSLSEGIILVTGPTGSGKTTTLYSAISELNAKEKNIMTIEDPVEYKLSHIAQIAVNPKIQLTFARGLRHILRQDPDVIMIGEIRDKETAEIAIQAALTGHLVLSTLHTNDAPSAITRLTDMGIEPYLLSSSILGVVAQRLVRKICPFCIESYIPVLQEEESLGIETFFRGKGCSKCYHTGYMGRVGLYELMQVTAELRRQMMSNSDAEELRHIALSEKMIELKTSGEKMIKNKTTTVEEVLQVIHSF